LLIAIEDIKGHFRYGRTNLLVRWAIITNF